MTVKRKDFQKAAALVHEFLLKLADDTECAELRDSLNLALLHMQRYYRRLRSRMQTLDKQSNGNHILSQSLRGLSPMTPFKDAPDKFQWKWLNLDNPKLANTLPADFNKEFSTLPPIIQATKAGDNSLILEHLERDPDCPFEVDGIGRTSLMYAVNFGHLDTLQILLENGVDVNAVAHDGSSAVHRACHDGNHDALQILIEYQADLQIKDSMGRQCIHWACAHKERSCLQLLLESQGNKVDTTVRDNDGMTPAMWACRMDNIEHFEFLSKVQMTEDEGIEHDNNGKTWMHWSVRRIEPLECLKTLLTEESACIKDDEGKTVIHTSAEMGSLHAVKIILEIAGKSVLEHRDGQNRTPLILATMGGHGEVVNYLLTEGAELGCVDETGATAWDYACKRQLHYCMLILASYIRQRAREEEEGIEAGQGDGYNAVSGMMDGTLGLDHLQINGQHGDHPILHGHRPMPPPHPPTEPPTPRTPRIPRPKTPAHPRTPRGQHQQYQEPITPRMMTESRPGYTGGVKRSPSTPDDNEEGTFFERQHKPSSANSSKRMKNEHSPDREALMSVMSMESAEHGSRIHSGHSVRSHSSANHHQPGDEEEPEMANDSQYIDGADDDNSRVSIDAMDVSDFDEDAEDDDGVRGEGHHQASQDASHYNNHSEHPAPSPRPPPQPHPNRRQGQPFSYAPKSQVPSRRSPTEQASPPPRGHHKRSPPPRAGKTSNFHNAHQTLNDNPDHLPPDAYIEAPHNGYDAEQEDYDTEVPYVADHNPDRAHQIHFPHGNSPQGDSRAIPPAHLSPLPNSMPQQPVKKKKKKKKKERAEFGRNEDFPQTRGYVAAIPPPLPHNQPQGKHPPGVHPPSAAAREQPPPQGRVGPGSGGMVGAGNVRPNSGSLKPMPKKRQSAADQDPRVNSQSDGVAYDSDEDRDQGQSQGHGYGQGQPKGRRFQNVMQNGNIGNDSIGHQNGPMQKRPPVQNRRDPSPSQHPPSPRGRRPPSGSLGGANQQAPPWSNKSHMSNGRLPPSY